MLARQAPASAFLFVYGTLRSTAARRAGAPDLQALGRLLGRATVRGRLYLVDSSYPGLVTAPVGAHEVAGELWKLVDPDAALAILDEYEGCSEPVPYSELEYVRCLREVTCNGRTRLAWVYRWVQDTANRPLLADGNF